ncbi:MAG TPA: MGMT family protein [Chloroflexota bacterium]
MTERQLIGELRALGNVRAPAGMLEAVLDEVQASDRYASIDTALGAVFVAWNRLGISAVMKTTTPEEFEDRFRRRFGRSPRRAPRVPNDLGSHFDLRSVTEFERAVLLKAREIPRGEVRTYGWIAAEIGRPGAVRAVGSALRKNPVPVLIPCHRVVRSDGEVGQYALGGRTEKLKILAAEGVRPTEIERLARAWRAGSDEGRAAYG